MRQASASDLDALVALEKHTFRGVYEAHRWNRRQFRYYLNHPRALVAVAESPDEQLIGYVAGIVTKRGPRTVAWLYSLAVGRSDRRRGIGRRLLRWFITKARGRGCHTAVLEVATARRGARRLFEQEGFETRERVEDYYGSGSDALLMHARLIESSSADS